MKKLFILSCLLAFVSNSFGQVCNPNPAYTAEGFNPDSATGLPYAQVGMPYNGIITVNVPVDTIIDLPGVGLVTVTINFLRIDSIRVFSNGDDFPLSIINLNYVCNTGACLFQGGSQGCISINGILPLSIPDTNQILISSTMNVTHPTLGTFFTPQSYNTQYRIITNSPLDIITGTVYRDGDGSCSQDIGENGFAGRIVKVVPGNYYAYTNNSGNYNLTVNNPGNYTVTHLPDMYYWGSYCPQPNQEHSVTVGSQQQTIANIDFADTAFSVINDLQVVVTQLTQFARVGFPLSYQITLTNYGTTDLNSTLQMSHDSDLDFVSSVPVQSSYSFGTITWDLGIVEAGNIMNFVVDFMVSTSAQVGSLLQSNALGSHDFTDISIVDNYDIIYQVVQAPYDPNIKTVSHSVIDWLDISSIPYLTYTIHFQNVGTDTAFTVVISDTISSKLDLETFQVLSSSHPVNTTIRNPREIVWTFNNIQLPDSNVNELASHGFIKYRIGLDLNNLSIGDEIKNTAHIYFDFNEAVVTNTAITEIIMQPGFNENGNDVISFSVFPNPNNGTFTVETNLSSNGLIRTEVRNLFGQLVYAQDENAVKGQYRKTINMDFASGIYLVTLQTTEGSTTKKIEVVK